MQLASDWRYYEATIRVKALKRHTLEYVAEEIERVLGHRLPNTIIPLAGSSITEQPEEAAK